MTEQEREIYKSTFYNLIDIVIFIAKDGSILYGNKKAIEFYGYSEEEFLKLTVLDLRYKADEATITRQLRQARSVGIEFETIHKKKNGDKVPVKVRSVRIESCHNGAVISIIQDMKHIEREIERAKIFDISMDITEDIIIAFDFHFCVTIWNKAAEKKLGYSESEMIGKKVDNLIPLHLKDEMDIVIKLLKIGQTMDKIETARIHKDGSLIDLTVSYSPIYDKYHQIIGYLGVYSDISALVALNLKAEEYRAQSTLALEGGKFCIWDIYTKSKMISIHHNTAILFGYEKEELDGDYKKWIGLIHRDDLEFVIDIVRDYIFKQKEFVVEYRIITKNHEEKWVRSRGKVISYDENNKPLRLIGTTEDIEERKKYEKAMADKNRELEHLIEEIKTANNAKSQFLANMSHEIRTPLNGIISTVQLLKKMKVSDEEQAKLYDILDFSSNALKGIVTDILDLSKAEQKMIVINNAKFSLKNMMQSIFNELQLSANMRGIEAGYFYDPQINFDFVGDGQKVQQIIQNLVSNAIKFTEKGYISLKTKMVQDKGETVVLEIEVIDSGIGIEQENISKIFHAFTQIDASSDKKFSGTGLGLAICRQYAELLGGTVVCTSTRGKGSRFLFIAPFRIATRDDRTQTSKYMVSQSGTKVETADYQKTILSIDDNVMNQSLMEYIVTKMKMKFLAAYCAQEALDFLEKEKIDLILMDIQLPVINGYRLAEIIKQKKEYATVPIIAITAYSQTEDREKMPACRHG